MARKEIDVAKDVAGQGVGLDEISIHEGGVEPTSMNDMFKDNIELEAFMAQKLVILVFDDNQEGALKVVCPEVNGVRQPIVRGAKSKVKRKYVEVLARGISTKYDQRQQDPSNPASLKMIPMHRTTYPFSVLYDPDPRGPEWLQNILNEVS